MTAEDVERLLHVARRHRTDAAEVLGQDEIGLDAVDQVGVERVERLAVFDRVPNGAVDVARRRAVTDVELAA